MLTIENLLIALLFVGALAYLVKLFRQNFSTKSAGCAKGCGSCGAVKDFDQPLQTPLP